MLPSAAGNPTDAFPRLPLTSLPPALRPTQPTRALTNVPQCPPGIQQLSARHPSLSSSHHRRLEVKLRTHYSRHLLDSLLQPVELLQLSRLVHLPPIFSSLLFSLTFCRPISDVLGTPHTNTFTPVSSRSLVSTGDDRILFQVLLPQHSLPSAPATALPSAGTGLNTPFNNSMTSSVLCRLLSRLSTPQPPPQTTTPFHFHSSSLLSSNFLNHWRSKLKLKRNSTLRLHISQALLRKEKLCVVQWDSTRRH